MINDLVSENKALKYIPLYKENWWVYSLIEQQNQLQEQLQEQLNEALDKLYECSDELYRVKKENEAMRALLSEVEKVVNKDD